MAYIYAAALDVDDEASALPPATAAAAALPPVAAATTSTTLDTVCWPIPSFLNPPP